MPMAQPKASPADKSAFERQYVKTNLPVGAPAYSSEYVASLRQSLLALGEEEWNHYSYAVLVRHPLFLF